MFLVYKPYNCLSLLCNNIIIILVSTKTFSHLTILWQSTGLSQSRPKHRTIHQKACKFHNVARPQIIKAKTQYFSSPVDPCPATQRETSSAWKQLLKTCNFIPTRTSPTNRHIVSSNESRRHTHTRTSTRLYVKITCKPISTQCLCILNNPNGAVETSTVVIRGQINHKLTC